MSITIYGIQLLLYLKFRNHIQTDPKRDRLIINLPYYRTFTSTSIIKFKSVRVQTKFNYQSLITYNPLISRSTDQYFIGHPIMNRIQRWD